MDRNHKLIKEERKLEYPVKTTKEENSDRLHAGKADVLTFLHFFQHYFPTSLYLSLSFSLSLSLSYFTSLVGLVVKASASRMEDPSFESHLHWDFSGIESYQ